MQLVSSLARRVRSRRRYREFSKMPTTLLTFFAIAAALVTSGFGLVLSRAVPWYVAAVERVGWMNFDALCWGIWISAIAIFGWVFMSIYLRCERLLRDRWFQ